jgi:hypothetical protein
MGMIIRRSSYKVGFQIGFIADKNNSLQAKQRLTLSGGDQKGVFSRICRRPDRRQFSQI